MAKVKVEQARKLTPAEKVDIKVAKAAALPPESLAERIIHAYGSLGDQPPMTAASATMLACGLIFRDRRMTRAGVRMLAALGIATLVKSAIKNNVDRTRPGEVIDKHRYRLAPGGSKSKAMRSMPSGHSAGAAAVLAAAARDYPAARGPLLVGAATIAAAQLPTRNHFLTDIAAGLALGLASEALVSAVLDRID